MLISSGQRRWEVRTEAERHLRESAPSSDEPRPPGSLPRDCCRTSRRCRRQTPSWSHRVDVALGKGVQLRVPRPRRTTAARALGDVEVWLRTIPPARPADRLLGRGNRRRVGVRRLDRRPRDASTRLGRTHRPAQIQVRTARVCDHDAPVDRRRRASFDLRSAPALIGTAVDAESGLPVELRSVRLQVSRGGAFVDAPDHGQQPHTLGGGRFIVGLPPFEGLYRVLAAWSGQPRRSLGWGSSFDGSRRTAAARRPAGAPLGDRRMRSWTRGRLSRVLPVELLSMPDSGVPARELHGVRVPPEGRVVRSGATDREGRFEFAPAGDRAFTACACGSAGGLEYCSPIFCPPLDEELPIQLEPGSTLSGSLASSDGELEPDVPLVLTDGEAITRVAWTDAAGGYRFRDLPRGGGTGLPSDWPAGRSPRRAVEMRELTIEGCEPPEVQHASQRAGRSSAPAKTSEGPTRLRPHFSQPPATAPYVAPWTASEPPIRSGAAKRRCRSTPPVGSAPLPCQATTYGTSRQCL